MHFLSYYAVRNCDSFKARGFMSCARTYLESMNGPDIVVMGPLPMAVTVGRPYPGTINHASATRRIFVLAHTYGMNDLLF